MSTTVFILNHAPTKGLKGMTPFKAWYGWKPDVSFLIKFRCVGNVKATKLHLTKLEDRSTPMVLLGMRQVARHKVVISRDVVFDEKAAWDWENPGTGEAGGVSDAFVVKCWR